MLGNVAEMYSFLAAMHILYVYPAAMHKLHIHVVATLGNAAVIYCTVYSTAL
jgi:hypothetical protein